MWDFGWHYIALINAFLVWDLDGIIIIALIINGGKTKTNVHLCDYNLTGFDVGWIDMFINRD